ncbi:DUF551 domain-containing protein [Cronobacter sakazakii]|uniref:DUF551 domain-containing protein n=1 Tax=Cronobacter sakazakii TaxID=28141 RepID=UPI000D5001EE|nr:DUF551 domain-containing protein [Cronobacter sakazakii]MDI7682465.1 DUF551 domain-containing protein [Cronobacter sakazakii]PUY20354.1 hypothetical protein BTK72_03810 [Cronobacter sakazakii]
MSEISKERAQEIFLGNGPEPTVAEERELARIALDWLALRERAEPVGVPDLHKVIYHFRDLNEGFPVERFKADYVIAWMLANYPPAPIVTREAQPAPAPVVPEPVSQHYKLPEGWIACSERMPEREYVLAADFSGAYYLPSLPNTQVGIYADWFEDGKPSWDDGDGNDLHLKQVTHWMPLPEAPTNN